MSLSFLDSVIFPDSVSNGASGGPTFSTNVFTGNTGIEQRGIGWPRCRHKYKVDLGIRTDGDMEAARLIMFDILGKGIGFRFKDWADFRLTNENIGTGDGSTLVFNITKTGKVAGCMITEGVVKRGAGVRLLREGVVIHNGDLTQLKRFKDDVREVARGYECGLSFANFNDLREGDVVECFEIEMVPG